MYVRHIAAMVGIVMTSFSQSTITWIFFVFFLFIYFLCLQVLFLNERRIPFATLAHDHRHKGYIPPWGNEILKLYLSCMQCLISSFAPWINVSESWVSLHIYSQAELVNLFLIMSLWLISGPSLYILWRGYFGHKVHLI